MQRGFSTLNLCWLFLLVIGQVVVGCKDKGEGEETSTDGAEASAGIDEELPEGLTPEQAAKVVAKVGDRTITVGDVTKQINRLSPYIRRRWAAPEKRKEFLDKLIRVELLSQEAERQGLGDDPEVQRTVKQVMIRLLVKNDLENELLPTEIDEATLKAEYEKEHDKYHRPAQVRASQIVVKSKPEAVKLLADLKAHAKDARYFRQKAREVSVEEKTGKRGGDLGYFSKPGEKREDEPEVAQAVVEAVWKLENIGDMADAPVQSDAGWHIVKLTNKRPEMNRSFESVKRIIENRLLRDKRRETMDAFVKGLRDKAAVEVFDENLAKLEVDTRLPSMRGPANDTPKMNKAPDKKTDAKKSVAPKTEGASK